jgi:hypothetical protein
MLINNKQRIKTKIQVIKNQVKIQMKVMASNNIKIVNQVLKTNNSNLRCKNNKLLLV